jgi:hypothetical protein
MRSVILVSNRRNQQRALREKMSEEMKPKEGKQGLSASSTTTESKVKQ